MQAFFEKNIFFLIDNEIRKGYNKIKGYERQGKNMRIKSKNVFDEHLGFIEKEIYIDGEMIVENANGELYDFDDLYVIPALTDVHLHGAVGADFTDCTVESIGKIAEYQLKNGVAQICPTGMTLGFDRLREMAKTAYNYNKENHSGATVSGIHLEGPFLNVNKRGAHNEKYIANPDKELLAELNEISGGIVKILSISPETEGALELISEFSDEICMSIAHTSCDYEMAMKAIEKGAKGLTHTFNAMTPLSHRDPGPIGAGFENGLYAELICDGIHIHDTMIKLIFKLFGADKVVMISDSMRACGLSDGKYDLGGLEVTVKGRLATIEGGVIAGSATNLMECLRYNVSAGVSLFDSVKAAAVNPAKYINIFDKVGSIEPSKLANIVVLNKDLSINKVIFKGKILEN